MTNLKINGQEHAIKVNYDGLKYLNEIVKDGEQADLDLYAHIIYAGLIHTGGPYTVEDVMRAIERLDISEDKLMYQEITNASRYYNSVVAMMFHEKKRRRK